MGLQGDIINNNIIDKGHCYVQGDESFHSIDSRNYGQFSLGLVVGKPVFILYPFNRISSL